MDILVGSAASIHVDFNQPTGLQIPDAGTVTYSLFNHVGTGLVTGQSANVIAGYTYVSIPVDANYNTISGNRQFEKRLLVVSWQATGQTHQKVVHYRIISMPLYTTSYDDVRTFLGYNEDELRDDEIDLYAAYLDIKSALVEDALDEALTSGTILEQRANEAVKLTAVISLIPSLKIRTPREISSGTDKFSRFVDTPDFADLERQARERLLDLTLELGVVTTTTVTPFIFTLTVPTDPITGV